MIPFSIIFFSLCEVEEFQVKIASNDVVMQQLLSVAFSPTFDIFSIRLALDGFGYLSTKYVDQEPDKGHSKK